MSIQFAGDTMVDASNLLVTASHAVFHKEDNKEAPVAVVGYQFQHSALHGLFRNITTNVSRKNHLAHEWTQLSCSTSNSIFLSWNVATTFVLLFRSVVKIVQKHASQKIRISNAIY